MVGETGELVDFKEHGKYYLVKMSFDTNRFREDFIYNYMKGKKEELLFDDHGMTFVIESINWKTDDCDDTEIWIQIPKKNTQGMGVILTKQKRTKEKRLSKLRKREEEETGKVIVENTYVTIKGLVATKFGTSKEPLKVKAEQVKCSDCGTSLGFADNITYPIGTTEDICFWCEKKVIKKTEEWKNTKKQLTQQEKDIIEFIPPEPETNICPLCGDKIPDDTLNSPNILCEKCHRPIACPTCKDEILKPVGITSCPWCQSDPESTDKIIQSLRKKRGILDEMKDQIESDNKKQAWLREKFPGGVMKMGETTYGFENTSGSSRSVSIESVSINTDMIYPYRDKEHKLGKGNWGGQNLRMLTRNMGFDYRKEDEAERVQRATGRSTQRRLSAMNHFFDLVTKRPFMDNRQVLFFVDNQRMVRDTKRYLENLYMNKYNMGSGVYETVTNNIKVMSINIPIRGYSPTMVVFDLTAPISPKQKEGIYMNLAIWGSQDTVIIGEESIRVLEPEPKRVKVITDREHKDVLGYAMGNPENGILGIMDKGGTVSVRLANPGKRFLPGDPITIDDILEREDPIHELPVPAAMDDYKQRVANIAGIGFESNQKSWKKPSQSLTTTIGSSSDWGWFIVAAIGAIVLGLIMVWFILR